MAKEYGMQIISDARNYTKSLTPNQKFFTLDRNFIFSISIQLTRLERHLVSSHLFKLSFRKRDSDLIPILPEDLLNDVFIPVIRKNRFSIESFMMTRNSTSTGRPTR